MEEHSAGWVYLLGMSREVVFSCCVWSAGMAVEIYNISNY